MLVAIPLFGDEVSPRFGCGTRFLLATVEDNRIHNEEVRDFGHLAPWQLPEFLHSLGVAKVICGGVHRQFQEDMERCGMEVVWGVIGPAADALAALVGGTLSRDQFVCRGRRARRGHGGGRGQRGGPPFFPGGGGGRGGGRRGM